MGAPGEDHEAALRQEREPGVVRIPVGSRSGGLEGKGLRDLAEEDDTIGEPEGLDGQPDLAVSREEIRRDPGPCLDRRPEPSCEGTGGGR